MIRVVWFIACMGKWHRVVQEELKALQKSGLYDAADEILVCWAGKDGPSLSLPDKCTIVQSTTELDSFEFPALEVVKKTAKAGDKILYFHTKGVSRKGKGLVIGAQWREYLLWGCIERWKEHIEALDHCDVSGVQLTHLDKDFAARCKSSRVFAGNFWWTRGEWVLGLPDPPLTHNPKERWWAEGWVLSEGCPRLMDLHNLTGGGMVTVTAPFGPHFSRTEYDPNFVSSLPDIPPRMLEHRWQILNNLISHFGYERYLEIGMFRGRNYRYVRCARKESVDPEPWTKPTHIKTSDEFFSQTQEKWDLIFVDGLHTEEQSSKDIANALEHLSENGTIMVHDCNPETEWEQRNLTVYDKKGVWLGTVWRAFAHLRMTRTDLYMAVIDADFGCGIIRRGRQDCFSLSHSKLSFSFFAQHRRQLMNIVDPEDFWKWLETLSVTSK